MQTGYARPAPAVTPEGKRLPPDWKRRAPDLLTDGEWQAIVMNLSLSKREAEMVWQANYDESVTGIARRLGLSPNTVHTYRERLYRKLGVSSFCQVIAIVFATHLRSAVR
jgi:DNA-binding CsgD family transcriptional regulator